MRKYTLYTPAGKILSSGSCQDEAFELQLTNTPPGTLILEAEGDHKTQYISNGEIVNLPEKLQSHLVFDYSTLSWGDPRTLAQLKITKNAEINEWRLAANQSTFTFNNKEISCDRLSRSDIDGVSSEVSLTGALPPSFPGAWKTTDNSYVAIPDAATWILFVKAMVAQGSVNFQHSESLKATLAAATTAEQIDAIVW